MRLHRFYIDPEITLKQDFWLHDERLLHQWSKVLRFRAGQELVLFDGVEHERLYKLIELKPDEAHLQLITEFERQIPSRNVSLLWSLLKKDKNDWVLQKCTELGVSHFVPLLADRSEKTGFDVERAKKIIIEAAEQCGRSDIPTVREPMHIDTAINDYKDKLKLFVSEQGSEAPSQSDEETGVLIGPEGGWSDDEKKLFEKEKLGHLDLHDFTLRAETACITAVTKLIQ